MNREYNKYFPNLIHILVIAVVFLLVSFLLDTLYPYFSDEPKDGDMFKFLSYTISFSGVIIYALITKYLRKDDRPLLRAKRGSLQYLVFFVLLSICAGIVMEPLIKILPSEHLDSLKNMMNRGTIIIFTSIVVAPILEEILFRGIIQEGLTKNTNPTVGIFVSALIFGVVHINLAQVIYAFVMGLVLGYAYMITRSVGACIWIHFFNNAIAYVSMASFGDAMLSTSEILPQKVYYIVYFVALIFLLINIVRLIIHSKRINPIDLLRHRK